MYIFTKTVKVSSALTMTPTGKSVLSQEEYIEQGTAVKHI